jgi:hypothetical protein
MAIRPWINDTSREHADKIRTVKINNRSVRLTPCSKATLYCTGMESNRRLSLREQVVLHEIQYIMDRNYSTRKE